MVLSTRRHSLCSGGALLFPTPTHPPLHHTHSLAASLLGNSNEKKKTRLGQSPDTFPSNFHCRMCSFSALMACHFTRAFGQELNLESKQIFRRAIFHQVLIFFYTHGACTP